jgi:hypothetical protein
VTNEPSEKEKKIASKIIGNENAQRTCKLSCEHLCTPIPECDPLTTELWNEAEKKSNFQCKLLSCMPLTTETKEI